ncbi:LssY C-terminal domain-containing protein [Arthrobacter sp. zg-Y20]|uniref:LssY C-terminal domain-containing protein n=1 Tax=unclassified Arthrobacter TaxID=235627 RepID=UPI001D15626C|nr:MULTISPECIES: LssY C-terminal domain-containing protein [unclassified Arthrobacter]MCC3275387.1 LssY C-terminal domain-containing protein [Arthrobacter sp. zg-Y20]MDK1315546.1 LssY C-terminal domain-containing protein [Arthrobacter sp. zg.Y20]WIB05961.1 LssY C-terminal domain-containing protein [Arthrobacter sp. zg-Y20]
MTEPDAAGAGRNAAAPGPDTDPGPGPGPAATALDSAFFAFSGLAAIWFAVLLFQRSLELGLGHIGFLIVFWAALAYLVLPRVDRILTKIFIPDYFMGRTRTNAGLFGDAVNLAFLGTEEQLRGALGRAGWHLADPVTLSSSWRIVSSTLLHRSYPYAPVSPLLLFGREQDFAYEQEVDGNPRQRHHVRFWRCPEGWMLPGGIASDWLAAASFDRAVGLSLFTLQVTHRVGENIDAERDYLVSTMEENSPEISVQVIKNFSSGYHSRNGGGDSIATDGDLPVVDLARIPEEAGEQEELAAINRTGSGALSRLPLHRPAPVVFGAVLVFLRGVAAFTVASPFLARFANGPWVTQLLGEDSQGLADMGSAYAPASVSLTVFAGVEAVLAVLILRGSNIARVSAMSLSSAAIILQVVTVFSQPGVPLGSNLFGYSFDILLILALSSSRARIYARMHGRRHLHRRVQQTG